MKTLVANFIHACLGAAALAQSGPSAPLTEAGTRDFAVTLSSPCDYEVFQRSRSDRGVIVVAGTWTVPAALRDEPTVALEARLDGAGSWLPLPFSPKASGFRCKLPAPAVDHWTRVTVRLRVAQEVRTVTEVAHVGVGEVFVVAGQSNSANHGEVRTRPTSGLVSAFDGKAWRIANDPQPIASGCGGSFIPSLGDDLVAALHVPVGFCDVGQGSTSVREWLPATESFATAPTKPERTVATGNGRFSSDGALFERLAAHLEPLGPHGVRAVLWHQGESDWNQGPGHAVSPDEYRRMLATVISASRQAVGWDVPWIVAQASYHKPDDPGSEAFRAAQRAVADNTLTFAGPDTDSLAPALREHNGRGVHFSEAGLKAHADLWAAVLVPWIQGRLGAP